MAYHRIRRSANPVDSTLSTVQEWAALPWVVQKASCFSYLNCLSVCVLSSSTVQLVYSTVRISQLPSSLIQLSFHLRNMVQAFSVLFIVLTFLCICQATLILSRPQWDNAIRKGTRTISYDDDDDDEGFSTLYSQCYTHHETCKEDGTDCLLCAGACYMASTSAESEDTRSTLVNMAAECETGDFDEDDSIHASARYSRFEFSMSSVMSL